MANPTLDRNRPYGLVLPAGSYLGAYYDQDGALYDGQDQLIVVGGSKKKEAAPVAVSEPAPATEQAPPVAAEPAPSIVVDDVDLAAWARGDAKYIFGKVKKAMAEAGYPTTSTTTAAQAREMILATGHTEAGDQ
jgi:hypothetical protein